MLTIKTPLSQAQRLKQFLIKNDFFNRDYQPKKENDFIYFPLNKKPTKLKFKNTTIHHRVLPKIEKPLTLQKLLKNKLTKKQLDLVPSAQEQIGSIMILEMPKELIKKEKLIAQALLQVNRNITTVVKKSHPHKNVFRLRKVKIIAGKRTKETIHKENNIRLKINLEKTYFSARLANERLRIKKQIKKPEEILVMFSGAGPYSMVLAKNPFVKSIHGVEINPLAHRLALENIKLNKLEHKVFVFQGDVRTVLPKIKKKFDRILMPLPKTGEQFLGVALIKAKPGAIVHLYAFLDEDKIAQETKKIKDICKQYKRQIRILRKVQCGQFAPNVARYCFDIKVIK
ncbi:class I SAM-dependent methyltransferase family protein [Candidatus Woesearchaeota archaeon]|nr:class I SAM-dependent methyltransferase family protein [Candidatus Woesearchaeota archaeon]